MNMTVNGPNMTSNVTNMTTEKCYEIWNPQCRTDLPGGDGAGAGMLQANFREACSVQNSNWIFIATTVGSFVITALLHSINPPLPKGNPWPGGCFSYSSPTSFFRFSNILVIFTTFLHYIF